MNAPRQVHVPGGLSPVGTKVRAHCACGFSTSPRVDERRALEALESEHGYSQAVCALCGRDYEADPAVPHGQRYNRLEILADPQLGDRILVCRDAPQHCQDGAARRQLQQDRAAADALNVALPRPTLRVIR